MYIIIKQHQVFLDLSFLSVIGKKKDRLSQNLSNKNLKSSKFPIRITPQFTLFLVLYMESSSDLIWQVTGVGDLDHCIVPIQSTFHN